MKLADRLIVMPGDENQDEDMTIPSYYVPSTQQEYPSTENSMLQEGEDGKEEANRKDGQQHIDMGEVDMDKKAEDKRNQRKSLLPFAIISVSHLLYTMNGRRESLCCSMHIPRSSQRWK